MHDHKEALAPVAHEVVSLLPLEQQLASEAVPESTQLGPVVVEPNQESKQLDAEAIKNLASDSKVYESYRNKYGDNIEACPFKDIIAKVALRSAEISGQQPAAEKPQTLSQLMAKKRDSQPAQKSTLSASHKAKTTSELPPPEQTLEQIQPAKIDSDARQITQLYEQRQAEMKLHIAATPKPDIKKPRVVKTQPKAQPVTMASLKVVPAVDATPKTKPVLAQPEMEVIKVVPREKPVDKPPHPSPEARVVKQSPTAEIAAKYLELPKPTTETLEHSEFVPPKNVAVFEEVIDNPVHQEPAGKDQLPMHEVMLPSSNLIEADTTPSASTPLQHETAEISQQKHESLTTLPSPEIALPLQPEVQERVSGLLKAALQLAAEPSLLLEHKAEELEATFQQFFKQANIEIVSTDLLQVIHQILRTPVQAPQLLQQLITFELLNFQGTHEHRTALLSNLHAHLGQAIKHRSLQAHAASRYILSQLSTSQNPSLAG